MPKVYVINKFQPNPYPHAVEVDTTSKGQFKDLSPFYLGPVRDPFTNELCNIFENYWQYSKVYFDQWDYLTGPTQDYWDWRAEGFKSRKANRYPKGKGVAPVGSIFGNEVLDYIPARKRIYSPFYYSLVRATKSYALLFQWFYKEGRDIVLRDFDGYDYKALGMTLVDVVNNPNRKQGHAFVIAGMLTGKYGEMIK